ncbi:MAG: hypothetical protein P8Z41_17450, partial [Anaerolineales bacterium]
MNKEIMITVKANKNARVQINMLHLPVIILVVIVMSACAPSTTQIADQAANVANGTDIPNAADSATVTFTTLAVNSMVSLASHASPGFTAKSKSSDYGSAGKCYSGATATVQMSFSAEGCPTLNPDPFSVSTGTPYFLYAGCAKEPSGAPFYEIISEGLVRNMLQIWGKPALLAGIVDSDVEVRLETAWITISPEARAAGIETSDMVAILIPAVENDHATTQCWYNAGAAAALALGDLANEEKEFA